MDRLIKKYKPKYRAFMKEKFTRDGSGWLLLQQLIIAPMSLLTTVLLARILSITDYGYYKYVLSIYGIVAIFGFTGLYNITSMNIQRGEDVFFNLGFQYRKLLRWIPTILTLIISIYYFVNGNIFFGILFLITIFSHLLVDLYDFYIVMTFGRGDFKLNAVFSILNYFFSFFPPLLIAYLTHNLYYVFGTLFLCQFLFRYFSFKYLSHVLGFTKKTKESISEEKVDNFKKEFSSLSFNNAIGSSGVNVSSVIVFNRLGAESNAVYSLALTFADFVGGIIAAPLSKALFLLSRMTNRNASISEKVIFVKSLFKKYFFFSLLGVVFCMLALPLVYKFLFFKYLFSYKYAIVYSLSILGISLYPAFQYFYEKRNLKFLNTMQIILLVVNMFLMFFSAMYFGVWGAIMVAILIKILGNLICAASLPKA